MKGIEGGIVGSGLVWGECARGWFELLRAGQMGGIMNIIGEALGRPT